MRLRPILTSAVVLLVPLVALAAPRTFKELAEYLVSLMNRGIGVLVVAGLVVYLFGVSSNIIHFGDGEKGAEKRRNFFVWGIVILFVMVSVWGILALLKATFLSTGVDFSSQGSAQSGGFLSPEQAGVIE